MGLLQNIYRVWTKDPYWALVRASFSWRHTCSAETDFGFKFKYTITCFAKIIDRDEFRAARMLEQSCQEDLIKTWHREVFLPKFKELQCSFRFVLLPLGDIPHEPPSVCRVAKKGEEEFIFYDHHCRETILEVRKVPFRRNGCDVEAFHLKIILDDAQLQENYNMIPLTKREAFHNTEEYRVNEEAVIVMTLQRKLELEREFQLIQSNQTHGSKYISVKTRLVGQVVELSWDIMELQNTGYVLRGYRKEGGFTSEATLFKDQGACVVDAQSNGKSIQYLEAGKEFYYTFLLTKDEPVHEKQNFLQSMVSSATVIGTKTRLVDSLRFSVRVPTQMEIMQVERTLEKVKAPPVDPKREKINSAFAELQSFVEFDDSITAFRDELIKKIKQRGYTKEIREDKIGRLNDLVDSMLVN